MLLYAIVRLDIAYVEGNALRPTEKQLLQLLYQRARDVAQDFTPQEVTSVMWAQATLFRRADMILDHDAASTSGRGMHRNYEGATDSAARRQDKATLPSILLSRIVSDQARYGAFEISNILWAIARLELQCEAEVLEAIEQRCCGTMHDMTAQGVTNILWSLARLDVQPSLHLREKLIARALALLRSPGGAFTARGVARSLEAVGLLKMDAGGAHKLAESLLRQYLVIVRAGVDGGSGDAAASQGLAQETAAGVDKRAVHGDDVAPLLSGLLLNADSLRAAPSSLAADVLEDVAARVPHFAFKGAAEAGPSSSSTIGPRDLSSALASIASLLLSGRDYEQLRQTAARSLPWNGEQGHLVIPESHEDTTPTRSLYSLTADQPQGLERLHSAVRISSLVVCCLCCCWWFVVECVQRQPLALFCTHACLRARHTARSFERCQVMSFPCVGR